HYAARPSEVWSLYSGTRWRLPPQVGTFEDVHDLVELALAAMDGMQIRMFRDPPLDLETQWARAEKVLLPSPIWHGLRCRRRSRRRGARSRRGTTSGSWRLRRWSACKFACSATRRWNWRASGRGPRRCCSPPPSGTGSADDAARGGETERSAGRLPAQAHRRS